MARTSIKISDLAATTTVDDGMYLVVDDGTNTKRATKSNLLKELITTVSGKVDKIEGKSLSTNDYTTSEKTKLANIEEGATKTTIDNALSTTSTNPVQNKLITSELNAQQKNISLLQALGLSVVDGQINITYEGE